MRDRMFPTAAAGLNVVPITMGSSGVSITGFDFQFGKFRGHYKAPKFKLFLLNIPSF